MTEEELKEYLETEGYFNIRILPDGLVGCMKMIYTTGVFFDLCKDTHEGRVCYTSTAMAIKACDLLNSVDDEPLPGFTADKRRMRRIKFNNLVTEKQDK